MRLTIDDLPAAIRMAKATLRASLPGYAHTFRELEGDIARQVDAIRRAHAQRRDVIPVLRYADIANASVDPHAIAAIRTHGAVVIRGVFDTHQARDWNDEIGAYLDANRFVDRLDARAEDRYFGNLASSKPQIYGVYWSKPQVAARQSPALTHARVFLNRLWRHADGARVHFDPDRVPTYADRIRRRPPGSTSVSYTHL